MGLNKLIDSEGILHEPLEQRDRVSYSEGAKINVGNYESRDVHMSYTTDIKEGETTGEAMERAKEFIEEAINKEIDNIKDGNNG